MLDSGFSGACRTIEPDDELALVFLLFQDLNTARQMMTFIDSNLGVPLPEKNYAENCALTPKTLWVN